MAHEIPELDQALLRAILDDLDTTDPDRVVAWLAQAIATAEAEPVGAPTQLGTTERAPTAPETVSGRRSASEGSR
jgi:uncharacterized membrane-anchored protein